MGLENESPNCNAGAGVRFVSLGFGRFSAWRWHRLKWMPHQSQDRRLPLPLRATLSGILLAISIPSLALAWDGVDSDSGGAVEIGKGNLVRSGETIEIYDDDAGEYRDVDVQSIERSGSSVEIEVYDNDSGEYRTFEMDD